MIRRIRSNQLNRSDCSAAKISGGVIVEPSVKPDWSLAFDSCQRDMRRELASLRLKTEWLQAIGQRCRQLLQTLFRMNGSPHNRRATSVGEHTNAGEAAFEFREVSNSGTHRCDECRDDFG